MRQPGVEPGSPAWKAGILTVGLLTRPQGYLWPQILLKGKKHPLLRPKEGVEIIVESASE